MKKIILVVLVLAVVFVMLFGCTGGVDNNVSNNAKITSQSQALDTVTDVGSDLSGISGTLNDIELSLTDTNA